MFKFQFMRTCDNMAPTHDHGGSSPTWPSSPLAPAWQATWEWLHGAEPGTLPCAPLPEPSPDDLMSCDINRESARVGATYAFARAGADGVEPLTAALQSGLTAPRRAAMYGLSAAASSHSVDALLPLLDDPDPELRTTSLWALGESASPSQKVIAAVKGALDAATARLRQGGEEVSTTACERTFLAGLRFHTDGAVLQGSASLADPYLAPIPRGERWKECQVAGQAVYCLASRLASLASPGQAEQEQVLALATDLLASRNDQMLPEGSSAEDIGSESEGAVSNKAPGLRRHGAHALLCLTAVDGIDRSQALSAALAATEDEDRYVQQPAWDAVNVLTKPPQDAEEDGSVGAADKLIDRLLELRLCPVTATGSSF